MFQFVYILDLFDVTYKKARFILILYVIYLFSCLCSVVPRHLFENSLKSVCNWQYFVPRSTVLRSHLSCVYHLITLRLMFPCVSDLANLAIV